MEKYRGFQNSFILNKYTLLLILVCVIQSYVPKNKIIKGESPTILEWRGYTKKQKVLVGEQVISFTLVNADTEQDIQPITNGATLDLALLPTNNLNIRANTNPAIVGSVKLALTGSMGHNQIDNVVPYALFGGDLIDYNTWTPLIGGYTVKATPYPFMDGEGTAGASLTISFTVINSHITPLVSNVKATTGHSYYLSELVVGANVYTDRSNQITSVPSLLNEISFIQTPNSDKSVTSTSVLSFKLSQAATVYVGYDPLAKVLPAWLSSWQKLTVKVGVDDNRINHLILYSKTFAAGIVNLGGNLASPAAGSQSNYIVLAKQLAGFRPYVTAVRPINGATQVPLDQSVSVDLKYPGGQSILGSTVNTSTVKLYAVGSDGVKTAVTGTAVNSTAAGDAITLSAPLKGSTTYEFQITNKVTDDYGNAMIGFSSRFKTTNSTEPPPTDLTGVSFTEQTLIDNSFGIDGFTTLVIGPDRRLYAATSGGKIERWDLRTDGTIYNRVTFSPFGSSRRLLIGFHFDPAATSSNLIAWISHSSGVFTNAPDWAGKISRINLNNPTTTQVIDYVVNLPRSYKDHSTNSIDFGPDGALYFLQGSNTAMGAPDPAWGNRPERLLAAAVLRLDITKARQLTLPLDAKTSDGGNFNPYAANSPLTIYATGVRNAYDLVWHSNGELYVPTNGSAAGGSTPELKSGSVWSNGQVYTGPTVPAMTDVRDTQNDYLFRIVKGGYYGHPNTLRNEYILNGANPTANTDPGEVVWTINNVTYGYPVGTPKEPNYKGYAYDFGLNKSPNGVIEYKSNAFGGKLKGKMLVCRFSGGDDVMVLHPGTTNKNIIQATEGIKVPGLRRPFANPLDIIEDVKTGNLYLSEYYDGNGDGQPRLTLLKANQPATTTAARTSAINNRVETEKENAGLKLMLYPNPNAGDKIKVAVKAYAPQEEIILNLFDVAGHLIQSKTMITDHEGSGTTDIIMHQPLRRGAYVIKASAASGKKQAKIVVK